MSVAVFDSIALYYLQELRASRGIDLLRRIGSARFAGCRHGGLIGRPRSGTHLKKNRADPVRLTIATLRAGAEQVILNRIRG